MPLKRPFPPSKSCDADYGVFVVDFKFLEVFPALQGVVFGVFNGVAQCRGNKMVNMQLSNAKLVDRGTRMIVEELALPYDEAKRLLLMHGSVAVLAAFFDCSDNIGRGAGSCDADYGVFVVDFKFLEVFPALQVFDSLGVDSADIVFLGNSLTNGGEWDELLGMPNAVNRGISGDTTEGKVTFGIGEEGIEVYPRGIDALGVRGENRVDVANHLFFAEYTLIRTPA